MRQAGGDAGGRTIAERSGPVTDSEDGRMKSLTDRARSVLANVGQDDRVKQAAAVSKDVASRAGDASKTFTRKVTQEDAWEELRADVELQTEIAQAHHALIIDLLDRVAELEARTGAEPRSSRDG
jgi:hypothetical protein